VSLTTGRDLLQTHFAPTSSGARRHRSEWAHVVASQPVSRALLAEIGSLARQVACQGADLALSPTPGEPEDAEDRRRLNAACQWLWVADASVRAAHRREPLSARDHELLQAIPVNALPPRRVPGGREPVTALCEGVITSAERVRHLAWAPAEQAHSSRDVTVTSLRHIAETSTVPATTAKSCSGPWPPARRTPSSVRSARNCPLRLELPGVPGTRGCAPRTRPARSPPEREATYHQRPSRPVTWRSGRAGWHTPTRNGCLQADPPARPACRKTW